MFAKFGMIIKKKKIKGRKWEINEFLGNGEK